MFDLILLTMIILIIGIIGVLFLYAYLYKKEKDIFIKLYARFQKIPVIDIYINYLYKKFYAINCYPKSEIENIVGKISFATMLVFVFLVTIIVNFIESLLLIFIAFLLLIYLIYKQVYFYINKVDNRFIKDLPNVLDNLKL